MPTVTHKAARGVLRVRPAGQGDYTDIDVSFGRGPVNVRRAQRAASRVSAAGRQVQRPLGIYDVSVETTVRDNPNSAALFGWFDANGRSFDVQWLPNGEVVALEGTGYCRAAATMAADRTRRIMFVMSGSHTVR